MRPKDQFVKSAMRCEASTQCRTSAKPWSGGWLLSCIPCGLTLWSSSLSTTVESVRIFDGMTLVICKEKTIWNGFVRSLVVFQGSSSGFRQGRDKLLNVFSNRTSPQAISLSSSVILSLLTRDRILRKASPTLRELHRRVTKMNGRRE